MQLSAQDAATRERLRRQSGRIGAIPGLFLGLLIVVLVSFVLYPWAFNIGGHFTPFTVWNGYGKLQSSTGATYGLYTQFWLTPYRGHGAGNNLHGQATLCTPKGVSYQYNLGADVKRVWSTTEGKTTYLYFGVPANEKGQLLTGFDMVGVWRNGELVVDDKGSMRMSFKPDGTAAGKGWSYVSPSKEHVWGTVSYGAKDQFEPLCKEISGGR